MASLALLQLLALSLPRPSSALTLPKYLQSGMVLQSEPERACLWGWAKPGFAVGVTLTRHAGTTAWAGSTVASSGSGEWRLCLPAQLASSAPASIRVSEAGGGGTATLTDLLLAATM